MDKAANAVGGAISDYQLKHHKLSRRVTGLQGCVLKYMSDRSINGQPQDPCFFGMLSLTVSDHRWAHQHHLFFHESASTSTLDAGPTCRANNKYLVKLILRTPQ